MVTSVRRVMTKLFAPEQGIKPRLELSLNTARRETLEADDFVQSIHGRILIQKDQDESEQMAGYVSASLLQFGNALQHGASDRPARRRHLGRHRQVLGTAIRSGN